jgi:hypothetical protein
MAAWRCRRLVSADGCLALQRQSQWWPDGCLALQRQSQWWPDGCLALQRQSQWWPIASWHRRVAPRPASALPPERAWGVDRWRLTSLSRYVNDFPVFAPVAEA